MHPDTLDTFLQAYRDPRHSRKTFLFWLRPQEVAAAVVTGTIRKPKLDSILLGRSRIIVYYATK
jgi:hypothetical protein